jgi:hypothetical protein
MPLERCVSSIFFATSVLEKMEKKCRVCGDVRRPKTSLVQATEAQLRQLQRIISESKLKKDELSHEIEVKLPPSCRS